MVGYSPPLPEYGLRMRAAEWRFSDFNWDDVRRLPDAQAELAWHLSSQACFAEEAGMLTAASLARRVDDRAARRLLALQASDESKHSEIFERYARKLGGTVMPPSPTTINLLEGIERTTNSRCLFLLHSMLESLALEEFRILAATFDGDLLGKIFTRVRTDEANHVAMGVDYLRSTLWTMESTEIDDLMSFAQQKILTIAGLDDSAIQGLATVSGLRKPDVERLMIGRFKKRLRQIFGRHYRSF